MIYKILFQNSPVTFTWETLIAIIGALAWLAPWIYQFFQRPKLKGKIISQHVNKGVYKEKDGLIYFLGLSIISLYKHFNIKEIRIKVKYPGDTDEYHGSICWFRKSYWVDSDDNRFSLDIPNNEFLGFMSTFPKDDSRKCYLTFLVDKGTLEEYDYIKLEFIPYRGKIQTITFRSKDINPDLILWDDAIWRLVPKPIG